MVCKICRIKIVGRSNKIFCSVKCKSYYHRKLRRVTNIETITIDKILHRNRSILLEVLGKKNKQIKIKRIILEKKKFLFKYITHFNVNSNNKMYHYVYDFAWMEFSNDEILIIRSRV